MRAIVFRALASGANRTPLTTLTCRDETIELLPYLSDTTGRSKLESDRLFTRTPKNNER